MGVTAKFCGVFILLSQTFSQTFGFQFSGVNEAGLEFGGADCAPQSNSIQQFRQGGHNLFRIPFAWEKMQPCIRCELDGGYLQTLKNSVNLVLASGGIALIDCHNYFKYYENLISDSDTDAFANLWWRLAQQFDGQNSNIWYGLMNEPHDMGTEAVFHFHQQAIWAIRGVNSKNKIVISGNGWDSLNSWTDSPAWYGTSNTILSGLDDPGNNNVFEMHLYFDYDGSGTHSECTNKDPGAWQRTTDWLRNNGKQALVTEFGLGNNDNCVWNYGQPFLDFLSNNQDVWLGYTYWSAGSCWPNDYIYTLDPNNGVQSSDNRIQLLNKYNVHNTASNGTALSNV